MNRFMKYAAVMLTVGSLAACASGTEEEEKPTTIVDSTEDNTIMITAIGDKDIALSGYITVGEGEHVVVEPALEGGSITMRFVSGEGVDAEHAPDFEGKDLPNPPVDYTIEGTELQQYALDPGEYYFLFTFNKAEGTVRIYTTDTPYEEIAGETPADDGQNPVMNFIGIYALDRASIEVAADDTDNALFTVHWASSAAEFTEWTMSGKLDTETLTVAYDNCVKKNYVFGEDGEVKSEETAYENGTGTITFVDDGESLGLTWNDDQEHVADDTVFGYVPMEVEE